MSRIDLISRFVSKDAIIAEIGVFEGSFTRELIKIGYENIILVDPWVGHITSGDKDGNNIKIIDGSKIYNKIYKEFSNVFRGTSTEFWEHTAPDSLDAVYIDGDHSYEGVRADIQGAMKCVRPGGWIMGHDYETPPKFNFGVKKAIDELGFKIEKTTEDACVSWAFRKPKRLVYTIACHDRDFASLVEFFPIRDALVICDSSTEDMIPVTFKKHVLPFVPKSPQEASYQKLRVFEFAPGYDEYMYLDLDIVSAAPPCIEKSWLTDPSQLHVVYETPADLDGHRDRSSSYTNPKLFNAGQFTFGSVLEPDFALLFSMCMNRPNDSYYEQGFMNHHFRNTVSFPFSVGLSDTTGTGFVHFTGRNKRARIIEYLNLPEKQKMAPRKVMIGTPSYDGHLDVWYTNALVQTIKDTEARGIEVHPIFMSYDAMIQRSRNDLMALAVLNDFDDLIFIDADIDWDPSWVATLLKYKVDVVGGTYRKKTDVSEEYVCKSANIPADVDTKTGLMKVDGLGCGFLRLSSSAMKYLWSTAEPYEDGSGKKARMIFDVKVIDGQLVSEDILMCRKLKEGGFDVHLDPRMCCGHSGHKRFTGNFIDWYTRFLEAHENGKKE